MSDVRKKYEALRDEYQRLARQAECEMLNLDLTPDQRQEANERAKVYWQMRALTVDTIVNAADAHPTQFRGQRKLSQSVESGRFDFLKRVYEETGADGRQELTHAAWKDPEAKSHFPSKDRIYKTLNPKMFDRIRKRP